MLSGSCLCGQVAFQVDAVPTCYYHCYCSMCRKASGSASSAFLHARAEGFRWLRGEALVQAYASSPGTKRCFCRVCGAKLPALNLAEGQVIIPAGSLDGDPGLRPTMGIFHGSRAEWLETSLMTKFYDAFPADEVWQAAMP